MTTDLARRILIACRCVLPPTRPLALHEPTLGDYERRLVDECIRSGWISTAGPYVERFERAIADYTGSPHVVATVNGTSALHGALLALGVSRNDEVLVPSLTFVATANAIAYCGATPHFVDVDMATLGVDARALDEHLNVTAIRTTAGIANRLTGRRIAALIVMHTFGHPANLEGLCEVAARWGLPLVEDAAESLGSTYRGRHTGTFGGIGILSFNGNKIVTTGGGGAILTSDLELGRKARHLCTTARVPAGLGFVHDEIGYNYRLPSINAALGLAQLERLPQLLNAKRSLAARYAESFAECAGARLFSPEQDAHSNHWLNTLMLDVEECERLDEVISALDGDGIGARPAWTPMHELAMYTEAPRANLDVTTSLARRIVNLPSSPTLAKPGD